MDSSSQTAILIGVGSNAAPECWVPAAVRLVRDAFGAVRLSTFYLTRPLGDPAQPPYVNGVIAASTALALPGVRAALRGIESRCGRVRDPQKRFAARTMDLDLLTFGNAVLAAEGLPAAELLERDFCLLPAAELWPDWVHPTIGRTLRQLATERFPQRPNILGPAGFHVG